MMRRGSSQWERGDSSCTPSHEWPRGAPKKHRRWSWPTVGVQGSTVGTPRERVATDGTRGDAGKRVGGSGFAGPTR
jgi:hypothetical protein